MLAEYIEPSQNNPTTALNYPMFSFDTSTQSIRFNLRMVVHNKANGTCGSAIRHPTVPCSSGSVSTPVPIPFGQEIIPRNFFIGADFN